MKPTRLPFLILNKLQQEGFENILSVEAIDYYTFKGSLPLPESRKLFNNIAFHRLSHDHNVSPDFLDGLIKYFENTEEYEKCSIILKKKQSLLLRV